MAQKISIIGLGKLGSCMLAAYASRGHSGIGVDINPSFVEAINNKMAPVAETDLQDYISKYHSQTNATTDYQEAIKNSSITFVIVPTPSEKNGAFSTKFAESSMQSIGQALKHKKQYHLIVLTSTVLPGDCETKLIPVLEKYSGKKCGRDFGFCYSPEFIAIGSVIHDLLNPDFFLIGQYDEKSGKILEKFYSTIALKKPPVKRMNIPSAELTKISLNQFLTTKITYANMLAEVAHNIPGAQIDQITDAIGSDSRIGKKYLRGGLGFGGPCFPRDNRAFAYMAKQRGVKVPYAKQTDDYNQSIIPRMVSYILKYAKKNSGIGIVGLSYKPGTGFTEESQGLMIAKQLAEKGYKVFVFEPHGYYHAKTQLDNIVHYCKSLKECETKSSVLFLTNWHNIAHELRTLLHKSKKAKVLIDPWRHFSETDFNKAVSYVPVGNGK